MAKTKAYSYVRFSSAKQERGDSVRRQVALAAAYAKKHDLDLDDTLHLHDLGKSAFRGRNVADGALGGFCEAVREGYVAEGSYLLVESLDRISRQKARQAVATLGAICDAGIKVVTLQDERIYTTESLDNDPLGGFLYAIIVAIRANEESTAKQLRSRAVWGKKQAEAALRPLTPMCPAWLEVDKAGTCYRVRPERVRIVKRVYKLTLDGNGLEVITRMLNAEGIEPWGRGLRKGKHWNRSAVRGMLRNRAVLGDYVMHRLNPETGKRERTGEVIPGAYPPILDAETFDRVQTMKAARVRIFGMNSPGKNFRSIFAGLLKCAGCGGACELVWKGKRNGTRRVVCTAAKMGVTCEYRSVPYAYVADGFLRRGQYIATHLPVGRHAGDLEETRAGLQAGLEAIEDSMANVMRAIERGNTSPTLAARLGTLERHKADAVQAIEDNEEAIATASPAIIKAKARDLLAALRGDPLDAVKVNGLLRQLAERVVLDMGTGEGRIEWAHGTSSSFTFRWPREP